LVVARDWFVLAVAQAEEDEEPYMGSAASAGLVDSLPLVDCAHTNARPAFLVLVLLFDRALFDGMLSVTRYVFDKVDRRVGA
jgi:hypothetical protein